MKQATKIVRIILIIFTAMLILSYFLPMSYTEREKFSSELNKYVVEKENSYLYDISLFDSVFSVWHIVLPLLAICFLFMKFKNSEYISYALYGSSCILAFIYFFMTCGKDSPQLHTSAGLYLYEISAIFIALAVIALIILNTIEKNQSPKPAKREDDFTAQIAKLTELKNQGLLSDEEFEAKRADLVKNLKL